ncbi:MAG: DUF4870 domain-containing protein [Candidatus Sumerlaeia bacterium]|nr:DUF4870 domain-containing protein [Candidatus Sumerlaeia bacterium]
MSETPPPPPPPPPPILGPDGSPYEAGPAAPPSDASPGQPLMDSDKQLAALGHLAGLLDLGTGIFGTVAIIVLFVIHKQRHGFTFDHLRQSLNLLILYWILLAIAFVSFFLTCGLSAFLFVPIMLVVGVAYAVLRIIAGIKAFNGETYTYPVVGSWRHFN